MLDGALQEGQQLGQQLEGGVNGAFQQGQSKFNYLII
mgnify:CR=1 FL=1